MSKVNKRCSWAVLDPSMIDGSITDQFEEIAEGYGEEELNMKSPSNRRCSWGNMDDLIPQVLPASSAPGLDSVLEDDSKASIHSSLSSSTKSDRSTRTANSVAKSKKAELRRKIQMNRSKSSDKKE